MNRPLILVMLLILQAAMGANEDERFATRVFFPPGLVRLYVSRAIEGAMDRLEDPACLQVLDDFTDELGSVLSSRLDDLHQTAGERLSDLLFIDATDEAACKDSGTGAYTTPGRRVIFVCGSRFASPAYSLTGVAGEILIIHELLHSLGLPEHPSTIDAPTSEEITRRVWLHCGAARSLAFRNRQNWARARGGQTNPSFRRAARPGFIR